MPENANPQVVAFANQQCRPIANAFYHLHRESLEFVTNYNAGNIGSLIDSAGAGELITDGSAGDGRTRIVGGDIYNLVTAVMEFIDYMEGGTVTTADRRSVIAKPHVHNE